MTEVISVKFKNRGKSYYFAPNGNQIKSGQQVVVETAKGLELVDCCQGNHEVEDDKVVQPLRPVVRLATESDLRVAQINKEKEKEAFDICKQKIEEHQLEMKLVDVECNFEGNKTTFFFTADGRVDFRELVKDLAGIFRNRIELRQIGVRDETKMLGGLGMCGRPYCCHSFVEEFQPVSTKMAKMQNLSLNPTKISGSCGRLMCCLRYEQEAYEDLISKAPKLGAFVETPAGFGTVTQVNLLRQNVKVQLDGEGDVLVKTYDVDEIAVVPGGRPANGEKPVSVLKDRPRKEKTKEIDEVDDWLAPSLFAEDMSNRQQETAQKSEKSKKNSRRRHRSRKKTGQNQNSGNGNKNSEQKNSQTKTNNSPQGQGKSGTRASGGNSSGNKSSSSKSRKNNRRRKKSNSSKNSEQKKEQ